MKKHMKSSVKMHFDNCVKNELKRYIRYYWYTTGYIEDDPGQQLLPMDHSDLIIQFRGAFLYLINNKVFKPKTVLFHGFRTKSIKVVQNHYGEAFGISFEPWGIYAFIGVPMSQFMDRVVNLSEVNPGLTQSLENIVESHRELKTEKDLNALKESIEIFLMKERKVSKTYLDSISIFEAFCTEDSVIIKDFCENQGIQRRKLERDFKKYIGVNPKDFLRIRQFEASSRVILKNEDERLTDIAVDSNYYDQSHFAKSFKEYTHHTPSEFKKEKPALKSKMEFK